MSEGIELADAIAQLRSELSRAIKAGKGKDLRFEVEDLELELQVVVTNENKGVGKVEAGLKFWLAGNAKASAEGSFSDGASQLQKIRLKLKPVGSDGQGQLLSGAGNFSLDD